MLFELPEIETLIQTTDYLSASSQHLSTLLSASTTQPRLVHHELSSTIAQLVADCDTHVKIFQQIEDDAEYGYLLPTMLDYESSLGESGQLPEWFATVLEKEYEKNKKVFDVHAKKVYKMQAMAEVPINNIDENKTKYEIETKRFKTLFERSEALNDKQPTILDIAKEAEGINNLTKLMKNKHLNYFKAVSDKLLAFLDQIKDKSIKMSNQLTHFIDDDTLRDKRWVNRSDMHAESSFGKHNIDYTTAVDNEDTLSAYKASLNFNYDRGPGYLTSTTALFNRANHLGTRYIPRALNSTLTELYY